MNRGDLTDADYWARQHAAPVALPQGGGPPTWYPQVRQWLPPPGARCLEVGAFPGATLAFFALRHGYRCTGVDLSDRLPELAAALAQQGAQAELVRADFRRWSPREPYDFVYSCGFVEHFTDHRALIERHWSCVRPGGLLVVSVPTLTAGQALARALTFTGAAWRELLVSHDLRIMRAGRLRRELARLPESELLLSRYLGVMNLWYGPHSPAVRPSGRRFFPLLRRVERLVARTGWSSRLWSPELVVVARRHV